MSDRISGYPIRQSRGRDAMPGISQPFDLSAITDPARPLYGKFAFAP